MHCHNVLSLLFLKVCLFVRLFVCLIPLYPLVLFRVVSPEAFHIFSWNLFYLIAYTLALCTVIMCFFSFFLKFVCPFVHLSPCTLPNVLFWAVFHKAFHIFSWNLFYLIAYSLALCTLIVCFLSFLLICLFVHLFACLTPL